MSGIAASLYKKRYQRVNHDVMTTLSLQMVIKDWDSLNHLPRIMLERDIADRFGRN